MVEKTTPTMEREPVMFRGSGAAGRGGRGPLSAKPQPVARPGNIALDVDRPLYTKGPNWDYA